MSTNDLKWKFQPSSSTPSSSCPYKGQWPLIINMAFTAFMAVGFTIKNLLFAIEDIISNFNIIHLFTMAFMAFQRLDYTITWKVLAYKVAIPNFIKINQYLLRFYPIWRYKDSITFKDSVLGRKMDRNYPKISWIQIIVNFKGIF